MTPDEGFVLNADGSALLDDTPFFLQMYEGWAGPADEDDDPEQRARMFAEITGADEEQEDAAEEMSKGYRKATTRVSSTGKVSPVRATTTKVTKKAPAPQKKAPARKPAPKPVARPKTAAPAPKKAPARKKGASKKPTPKKKAVARPKPAPKPAAPVAPPVQVTTAEVRQAGNDLITFLWARKGWDWDKRKALLHRVVAQNAGKDFSRTEESRIVGRMVDAAKWYLEMATSDNAAVRYHQELQGKLMAGWNELLHWQLRIGKKIYKGGLLLTLYKGTRREV